MWKLRISARPEGSITGSDKVRVEPSPAASVFPKALL